MVNFDKLNYLWLAPDGEVIYCDHEGIKAREILEEKYGIDGICIDATKMLLNYGWMCYRHDLDLGRGWMIHKRRKPIHRFSSYGTIPTLAQKDKILELFGMEFKDTWVVWNAVGI